MATRVELLEQAVAQQPTNSAFHYHLGGAYGQLAQKSSIFKQPGLAKKAKNSLERAVELDGNNIDARFALIDFYMIAPGVMGGSESKALAQATEIIFAWARPPRWPGATSRAAKKR